MITYGEIYYCDKCIESLKSFGQEFYVGEMIYDYDESAENGITCEHCGEFGNLYECEW